MLIDDQETLNAIGPRQDIVWSDESIDFIVFPSLIPAHANYISKLCRRYRIERLKVFISVRRQADWMASTYAQHSDRISSASQEDFERWAMKMVDLKSNYFLHGISLNYERMKQGLEAGFGASNVLFLPFELLRYKQHEYLGKLLHFFDRPEHEINQILSGLQAEERVQENVRVSGDGRWLLRPRSLSIALSIGDREFRKTGLPPRLLPRWLTGRTDTHIRLTSDLEREIKSRYASSNRQFSKTTGLNLERYDYF